MNDLLDKQPNALCRRAVKPLLKSIIKMSEGSTFLENVPLHIHIHVQIYTVYYMYTIIVYLHTHRRFKKKKTSCLGLYYVPSTFLTSLLGFQPTKIRSFTIKTRVKQALGRHTNLKAISGWHPSTAGPPEPKSLQTALWFGPRRMTLCSSKRRSLATSNHHVENKWQENFRHVHR